jgi:hypothetical protein
MRVRYNPNAIRRVSQMRLKRVLLAAGISVSFAGSVCADEIPLKPVFMSSHAECLSVLQDFNWHCAKFENSVFVEVYGDTYWKLTKDSPTPAFIYDIDEDGILDLVIPTLIGCGTHGCSYDIIFGRGREQAYPSSFGVVTDFAPLKTTCGGVPGLKFGKTGKCFLASEMKQSTSE